MSDVLGALKVVKVNGVAVDDIKNFKFDARTKWKEVQIGSKTRVFPLHPVRKCSFDYVVPANGKWEDLEEKFQRATIVVQRTDGAKATITGVFGNAGEESTDHENETVVPFDCIFTGGKPVFE